MSSSTANECESSENDRSNGDRRTGTRLQPSQLWAARSSIRRDDGSVVLSAQREAVQDHCFIGHPQERFRLRDGARGGAVGVLVVILRSMRRLFTDVLAAV